MDVNEQWLWQQLADAVVGHDAVRSARLVKEFAGLTASDARGRRQPLMYRSPCAFMLESAPVDG